MKIEERIKILRETFAEKDILCDPAKYAYPTKTVNMNELMREGFSDEYENVLKGKCSCCGHDVKSDELKSCGDKIEYIISGMCMHCQDKVFKDAQELEELEPYDTSEMSEEDVQELLRQAVVDDVIMCPGCESSIEPDCPVCGICGTKNPLVTRGLI